MALCLMAGSIHLFAVDPLYSPPDIETGIERVDRLLRNFPEPETVQREGFATVALPYRVFLQGDDLTTEERIVALFCVGTLYSFARQDDQSFPYLQRAADLGETLPPGSPYAGLAFGALGDYLFDYYEYDLALDYLLRALPTVRALSIPADRTERWMYFRIINILHELGQTERAVDFHERMIQTDFAQAYPTRTANARNDSGLFYHRYGHYDHALREFNTALTLYDTTQAKDLFLYVNVCESRAHTLVERGRLDEALRDLAYAYTVRKRQHHFSTAIQAMNYRLSYLMDHRRTAEAYRLYRRERAYLDRPTFFERNEARAYRTIAELLRAVDRPEQAAIYQDRYNAYVVERLGPQLESNEQVNLNDFLGLRSRSFRQQRQIEVLERRDRERERTRRLRRNLLWAGVVLLLVLAGGLWVRYRNERERTRLHAEQRERRILELENDNLRLEVASKQRDLHRLATDNRLRSEVKRQLYDRLREALSRPDAERGKQLLQLTHELATALDDETTLTKLQQRVEDINDDFEQRLRARVPGITVAEVRLCSLLRLGMNNQEIAQTLHKSEATVRSYRYRLRKKAGVSGPGALAELVNDL